MLGYTAPDNNVYVFFEGDEIERLREGKIQGTHFNYRNPKITGLLEVSVDDKISDRIMISAHKNNEGFVTRLHLQMRINEYSILKERKSFGLHEGFRHICLVDASRSDDFHDQDFYRQLKQLME